MSPRRVCGFAAALLLGACAASNINSKLDPNMAADESTPPTFTPMHSPERDDEKFAAGATSATVVRAEQKTEKAAIHPDDENFLPAAPGGPPLITFPGFRMLDAGQSRVFVDVSGKPGVNETRTNTTITIHLSGVTVPEKVNRMVLPTGHFWSPVRMVRVVQAGDGADLVIDLRVRSDYTTKLKPSPFGTRLTIDFPRLPDEDQPVAEVVPIHADVHESRAHPRGAADHDRDLDRPRHHDTMAK
jgi:hypothetical protein